ncbi:MAG: hypothetical protein SF339_06060 [Blastocatellia bacterium]|nr:hypothetical protein [Blastocatellia bacterium]
MNCRKAFPILLLLFSVPDRAAGAIEQVTFVQTPPASRAQNQESLPPEKKKSLSGIGPDEVFRERNEDPAAARRPETRSRPTAKPSATATPSPTPTATPTPPPTPTPAPPRETPTALPGLGPIITSTPSPPSPPPNANVWLLPGLGVLSLLVFAALVFVVGRLRQLLRES